jgi:Na+-translocating ferredoxin:NAD+ oxidoreductase RnfG subunit
MPESRITAVATFVVLTVACAGLLAGVAALTDERIAENRAREFRQNLVALTGSAAAAARLDWQDDVALLCTEQAILRGSAAGYGGDIRWLAAAALGTPPTLTGVRVTAHQETPGIADFLDSPDSGWLRGLAGRGAAGLAEVDAVSGATITSRALGRSLATALRRPAVTEAGCEP